MDDANPQKTQRGIPGRFFVIPFAVVLVTLLWLVFSMAARFQTIMSQLESTRSAWPAASRLYSARYSALDENLVSQSAPWVEQWKDLKMRFQSTTQFDQQSQVISRLEDLLEKHRSEIALPNEIGMQAPEIVSVRDSERKRHALQSDFVGKCTVAGLRLKLPPIFSFED